MKYISVADWRDLEDNHLYGIGEPYPVDGREVSEKRIAMLTTAQNKAGFVLIKAVEEKKPEVVEKEEPKAEEPKKATKSRKKAQ